MSTRELTDERGRIRIIGFDGESAGPRETADTWDVADDQPASGRSRLAFAWCRFKTNRSALLGLALVALLALLAVFARPIEVTRLGYTVTLQPISIVPYGPDELYVGAANEPPSLAHPFGTDWAGRDVFSRVLVGGRLSLSIGVLAVALALGIGVPLGAIAGYVGGWVDELIMRVVDMFYAFPFLVLAIVIVAIVGQGFWTIIFALVVTGWLTYARLLRGEILSVKESEYVAAARALGVPDRRILWKHVVPNAIAPVIVQATLNLGTVVLAAAALGFLGLGLEPGSAEWGSMLSRGRDSVTYGHYHVTVFPGLAIFLFVLAVNLVGDGINDALDPAGNTAERRLR